MGFGIYQIGGLPEAQSITKPAVVLAATTTATDLLPANPNRVALAIVNETSILVYLATGTIDSEPNRASATNKILEIPPKHRILLDGDNCPREALNIVWAAEAIGNLEAVERERI